MTSKTLSPAMLRLIDALSEKMVADYLAGNADAATPGNSGVTVPEKAGKTRKRATRKRSPKSGKKADLAFKFNLQRNPETLQNRIMSPLL